MALNSVRNLSSKFKHNLNYSHFHWFRHPTLSRYALVKIQRTHSCPSAWLNVCRTGLERLRILPGLRFPAVRDGKFFVSLSNKTKMPSISRNKKSFLLSRRPLTATARRQFSTSQVWISDIKPKLFYIQNPLIWLSNRWDFFILKSHWDPSFSLPDFMKGCKQALCTITQQIADEKYDELKGLISSKALTRLKQEVDSAWSDPVRRRIALDLDHVHIVLPHRVYLQQIVDNKYCDVDMILVGFKPQIPTIDEPNVGLLVEATLRFHRNYTEGMLPDWTVTQLHLKTRNVQIREKDYK